MLLFVGVAVSVAVDALLYLYILLSHYLCTHRIQSFPPLHFVFVVVVVVIPSSKLRSQIHSANNNCRISRASQKIRLYESFSIEGSSNVDLSSSRDEPKTKLYTVSCASLNILLLRPTFFPYGDWFLFLFCCTGRKHPWHVWNRKNIKCMWTDTGITFAVDSVAVFRPVCERPSTNKN